MLTYRQVGNPQQRIASLYPLDGEQAEIIKQALEVIWLGNILRGKSILDNRGGLTSVDNLLDDRGVRTEPLVETDQMAKLVVVGTDIVVDHILRRLVKAQIIAQEI